MAVTTEEIKTIYEGLSEVATGTLEKLFNSYAITEAQRGQVISNTIVALIQTSAQIALDAPTKDAQKALIDAQTAQAQATTASITSEKAIKETQSAKDAQTKDAQKALIDAQTAQAQATTASITSEKAIKETQSAKDAQTKDAQKALIDAQTAQAQATTASITSEKAIKETQSAKDAQTKDAQKALIDAQTAQAQATTASITSEKAIKETQSAKDAQTKDAQKALIDAQTAQAQATTASITSEKAIKETQSAKDAQTKDAQKALIDAQTAQAQATTASITSEKAIKETQSAKDAQTKDAQKALIDAQKLLVEAQEASEGERKNQIKQATEEATAKQPDNVANVGKQGELLDQQVLKLEKDSDLVTAQKDSVLQQVKDNRIIKALDIMGETYGGAMTGGLVVTADMWTSFYALVALLIDELKEYKGAWDATTAFPTITPVEGDFYNVSVAGTINVDGTSSWAIGDIVYFDGNKWKKSATKLPTSTTVVKA